METLKGIVDENYDLLEDPSFIERCQRELREKSILVLGNFLARDALSALQREAFSLKDHVYFCSQSHNVLLTEGDSILSQNHPCNVKVFSDKGCVPHDLIPESSFLNVLYNSLKFQSFIQSTLSLDKIFPYADNLSSVNYNYYQEHQQLGWHFDNASFAISLMIQSSDLGGQFQYVADIRNYEKNTLDISMLESVLNDECFVKKVTIEEGTLILFNGQNYLHRVTPVSSPKPRILATLNYNLEKNRKLSENARRTFFGRLC